MNFANNLKQLRTQRKLTQKEFAEIIGTSSSAITMYETGQREPNFTLLDKMATFFDVSTDYLLGRESNQSSDKYSELLKLRNKVKYMQEQLDDIQKEIISKLQNY